MRYYRLPPDEWHRLDDLLALHNKTAPPKAVSTAIVAENDSGQIVMVGFLMLACHFENLLGLPGGGGSVTELHRELERGLLAQMPEGERLTYYTNVRHSPGGIVEAGRCGLTPIVGFVPHYKVLVGASGAESDRTGNGQPEARPAIV